MHKTSTSTASQSPVTNLRPAPPVMVILGEPKVSLSQGPEEPNLTYVCALLHMLAVVSCVIPALFDIFVYPAAHRSDALTTELQGDSWRARPYRLSNF